METDKSKLQELNISYSDTSYDFWNKKILDGTDILLVDDNELLLDMNEEILASHGAHVVKAGSGKQAIEIFNQKGPFDIVIMDIVMPEMDGCETIIELYNQPLFNNERTMIIALTGEADEDKLKSAVRIGAYDCLNKPLQVIQLSKLFISFMKYHLVEVQHKLERARFEALRDMLTGVKNYTAYTEKIHDIDYNIERIPGYKFGMVLCDCNNLKAVNDKLGHPAGDFYIKNSCYMFCRVFTHSPVYRVGGDEFVAILEGDDFNNRESLIAELHEKNILAQQIPEIHEGRASIAFGLAVYDPATDKTAADVLKRADTEMYADKKELKDSGLVLKNLSGF